MIADTVDATSCVFLDGHAWMMLDPASFTALHEPRSPMAHGVVAEMCDLFTWSEFDKLTSFITIMSSKSRDFLPLYFVHHNHPCVGCFLVSTKGTSR